MFFRKFWVWENVRLRKGVFFFIIPYSSALRNRICDETFDTEDQGAFYYFVNDFFFLHPSF